jgi:hypothetical protein
LAASELLVTFKAAISPLSHITLWLADEKQSLNFDITSLFAHARSGIVDIMRRRLDSKTRGILEVSPNGTVNFLHRTARDWALQPSVWKKICSSVPEGFDPYLLLLKAETLRIPDRSNRQSENLDDLWRVLNKSLWYASQVVDLAANTLELVRVLKRLSSEAAKAASPYLRIRFGNERQIMDSWHSQRESIEIRLHWASTQCTEAGGCGNTFLGLMAQFCVLPYLRTELLSNPSIKKLKIRKNCVSLLENAVFGFGQVTNPRANNPYCISSSQRFETVSFLLERGASPKQLMFNGTVLIDEVRAAAVKEALNPGMSADLLYWTSVAELMEAKLRSRWTLKSVFERRRGS